MSKQRNPTCPRDVPAGLAQISAGDGVSLSEVQAFESLRRTQLVEGLGGLAPSDVRSLGIVPSVIQ